MNKTSKNMNNKTFIDINTVKERFNVKTHYSTYLSRLKDYFDLKDGIDYIIIKPNTEQKTVRNSTILLSEDVVRKLKERNRKPYKSRETQNRPEHYNSLNDSEFFTPDHNYAYKESDDLHKLKKLKNKIKDRIDDIQEEANELQETIEEINEHIEEKQDKSFINPFYAGDTEFNAYEEYNVSPMLRSNPLLDDSTIKVSTNLEIDLSNELLKAKRMIKSRDEKIRGLRITNKLLSDENDALNKCLSLRNESTEYINRKNKEEIQRQLKNKIRTTEEETITPVFLLSDLHYGQIVNPQDVFYQNSYNPDICYSRVINCVYKFCEYYSVYTNKIDKIVIACLSDSINNEHHGTHNALSISEQIVGVSNLYIECLDIIKDYFEDVEMEIIFTSSNHDRIDMTNKYSPKESTISNSYTLLIINNIINAGYHVKWEDCGSYKLNLYNKQLLFMHGHELKINTKNHNSIINAINKSNKQWLSFDEDGVDMLIMGHYHAPYVCNNFIIACSPVGPDPYGRSLQLPHYKPGLTTFAYTSKGNFAHYQVLLSDE